MATKDEVKGIDMFVGPLVRDGEGNVGLIQAFAGEGAIQTPEDVATAFGKAVQLAKEAGLEIVSGNLNSVAGGANSNGHAEKLETVKIDTVVRRIQRNKPKPGGDGKVTTTPVIDLYKWNADKTFGVWRILSVWLNSDKAIEAFENATGLVLEEMPLYNSQSALQRDKDFQEEYEVVLDHDVEVVCVVTVSEKKDDAGNVIIDPKTGKPKTSKNYSFKAWK